jgi:TatD DNase family protein
VNLPVVVHIREAMDDSLKILQDSGIKRGILHSFPGDEAQAEKAIGLGFFISFAGPITYPNSSRAEVASGLPLSRILTETDSPYLTPQAFRGKRNKPEYVRYVIEKLASIFSPYTFDDMERITSHNARRIFGLPVNKAGRIVYKIRRSLYINLTNRCSNNCYFCLRTGAGRGFVAGHYLLLKSEPSVADLVAAIENEREYDEVVFCGLGEPTLRLKELLEVAAIIRQKHKNCSLRLDTNGHGNLINKSDIPHRLKDVIDKVSVSLNAQDAETYLRLCRPERGKEAYEAMLKFIRDCVAEGIATQVSVVDLPDVDIEACRQIASNLGAGFRLRHYSRDEY